MSNQTLAQRLTAELDEQRGENARLNQKLVDAANAREHQRLATITHLETIEHLRHCIDVIEAMCSAYKISSNNTIGSMCELIGRSRRPPEKPPMPPELEE